MRLRQQWRLAWRAVGKHRLERPIFLEVSEEASQKKKKKLFVNWKDQYEFAKQRREGVDFKQKKKHVQRRKKSKKGLSITIV